MDSEVDANRNSYQFLDAILSDATRLISDPFSETTRARQRYLLVSSVITLSLTFSVFKVKDLSEFGVKGVVDISSEHLASIFATATIYLLLLFLVGAIQEMGLLKLRLRYFEKQKKPFYEEWMERSDELAKLLDERRQTRERLSDESMKSIMIMNAWAAKREPLSRSLGERGSELSKTIDAMMALPERSEDEGSELQAVRQKLASKFFAQSASFMEMAELNTQLNEDERKAIAKAGDESKKDAERARLVDLNERIETLGNSHDMGRLGETMNVGNLASGHLFLRAVVEIALPTMFAVASVAICVWRTHGIHAG
jgi:hypothetical protein